MKNSNSMCRYADMVKVGDSLLVDSKDEMAPAKVEHVSKTHTEQGG